jgi:hypothetical protein
MGSLPDAGQIVAVRQRLYLVEQSIPPVNPGDSTLVRLSCVDDDAQGQTLEVLWDIEPDARAHESDRWHGLGTREFDDPALFAAYVNNGSSRWRTCACYAACGIVATMPLPGLCRVLRAASIFMGI